MQLPLPENFPGSTYPHGISTKKVGAMESFQRGAEAQGDQGDNYTSPLRSKLSLQLYKLDTSQLSQADIITMLR